MKLNKKSIKSQFIKILKHYELLEKKNINEISLRKIEAFQPTTFNKMGYQTDIKSFNELWKFQDVMQENRFFSNIEKGLFNYLSKKEFLIISDLINFYSIYSNLLGKKNLPLNTLTRSLISYRFINQNFKHNTKILELGPGSGMLGMMLLKDGYKYDSYEVTKSFHIYQKITLNNFSELNNIDYKTKSFQWWCVLNNPALLSNYDLIIGNHMLNEMHPNALNYIISKVKKNSKFFFEGSGYNLEGDQERFLKIFEKKIYKLVYYRNLSKDDIYFGILDKCNSKINSLPNFQKNIFKFFIRFFKFIMNYKLSSYFSILKGRNIGNNYNYLFKGKKNYLNQFKNIIKKNNINLKKINDDDIFLEK